MRFERFNARKSSRKHRYIIDEISHEFYIELDTEPAEDSPEGTFAILLRSIIRSYSICLQNNATEEDLESLLAIVKK